jgi:GAF domain-containing protein
MLARGHKLKIGQIGIVGYVTGLGEARIALDVGQDAVFFDNPDLPETRSEMALPLIVGDKILGALDVQSTQPSAFSEVDITTLKVLADQVAIAIENARLDAEAQTALESLQRAYGESSRRGWERLLRERRTEIGYISLATGNVEPVSSVGSAEAAKASKTRQAVVSNDGITLHLPLEVRGEVIGAIRLDKPSGGGRWTSEDIAVANNLGDQLGTALESARLYEEISQRAEREYAIADITSKIGASVHLDTILHATVQELAQVFEDSDIILQIQKGAQA